MSQPGCGGMGGGVLLSNASENSSDPENEPTTNIFNRNVLSHSEPYKKHFT